jgi:Holliday junction resolvase
MTPEGKVKKRVTALLKARGAYYFTPVTGGFGTSGVPDIVACYKGKFLGIECKAGGRQPTALQLKNLEDIQKNGGESLVIREDTIDLLEELLNLLGETK